MVKPSPKKAGLKEGLGMPDLPMTAANVLDEFERNFSVYAPTEMTLPEYLEECQTDSECYHFAAQRMVTAIGEPEIVNTSRDPRLARIFGNREIRTYSKFNDFFGMEETIEQIVDYFRHAAQGLEESRQIIYLLGPVGGGKCEIGSTRIAMADGTHKAIKDLQVGDMVLSLTASSKVVVRRVSNTFRLGEKPVWGVRTARGLTIKAAATHCFQTQYGWEPVDQLTPKSFIATLRHGVFGTAEHDVDELKILAYLLGDGTLGQTIGFTCANPKMLEDCAAAVRAVGCELVPQSYTIDDDCSRINQYGYRVNDGATRRVKEMIDAWGLRGKHSPEKFIPEFVFRLNEKALSVFLSRLYATDGWASVERGRKQKSEIGYCSTSLQLAEQLIELLSKYGICAYLRSKTTRYNGIGHLPAYQVVIRDKDHIRVFLRDIGIFGKRSACLAVLNQIDRSGETGGKDRVPKNFVREASDDSWLTTKVDRSSKLKDQLRTQVDNNKGVRRSFIERVVHDPRVPVSVQERLSALADSDIYWDEIAAVEELGYNEDMYDIEVEGEHNYIANGIVSHNSSLVSRLRDLIEERPIYVLAYRDIDKGETTFSPYFSRVLPLFNEARMTDKMANRYDIHPRYFHGILGPWERKRLIDSHGSLANFRVLKMYPSRFRQIAISEAEPGDENTQDISTLVGKVDMRKLEMFSQNDPDAYLYSGGLNLSNQGLMEFKEMFKAKIKMLNPLLFAVQEHNYQGTENIAALPYDGIVVAHCFSEDTELLTENGWRRHDEIEIDDLLATMNPITGVMEYQPALRKFEQDYEGDMYHFCSHSTDHLVTPNHKMLYHTLYTNDWRSITAEDFQMTGHVIPVSAKNNLPDYAITDDLLRLMVWVVADGSLSFNKIRFGLKKERKIERLCTLLASMDIEFNRRVDVDGVTRIVIDNQHKLGKLIPDYYNMLSWRQCRVVLEEYAHADGHRTNGEDYHYQLSSNVKENIERLHHMAIVSGCKANQCSNTKDRYAPQYFLSVRLDVTETRADYIKEKTYYNGKVFCFETPNHTLVARRNGKVLICQNSNESEWMKFRNNRDNEAFLDRICIKKVPYCLRVEEEMKIYRKNIADSELSGRPIAPGTLEVLAQFAVISRLKPPQNTTEWSKMKVYNGENLREKDPKAKTYQEYREEPENRDEGFFPAISTRWAFKRLSQCFNRDPHEIAADPVHMLYVLLTEIEKDNSKEEEEKYKKVIKDILRVKYFEFVDKEIRAAYLESYADYGQNLFDRYFMWADKWVNQEDYFDPDTGLVMNRDALHAELQKIEKPADITNDKDFRNEVVQWVLRYRSNHKGENPSWKSYEKLRNVIEKTMFTKTEDLLPVISFGKKPTTDVENKHHEFVTRMIEKGYTERQIQRIVEWYMRVQK